MYRRRGALLLAVALACLLAIVLLLWPARRTPSPGPPRPTPSAPATDVGIVQANLKVTLSGGDFDADLRALTADHPDFLTLNETQRRTDAQLQPPGYSAWRGRAGIGALETPVLWRSDRWREISRGTVRLVHAPVRGGERSANWVTLADGSRSVSVVSVHALQNQGPPGRRRLAVQALDRLIGLCRSLARGGPVLVAGDFNVDYLADGPQPAYSATAMLRGAGLVPSYDVLGRPPHGTGIPNGAALDYVFSTAELRPLRQLTIRTHSDHLALRVVLGFVTG